MKKPKRILSLLLVLCLCVALLPAAFAADGDFTIENGVLTKYKGSGGAVIIPEGVTSIGVGAFSSRMDFTAIQGDMQSQNYISMDGILFDHIKNQLNAYSGEKQESHAIFSSVISIEYNVNGIADLADMAIPEDITSIEDHMFPGCANLTSVAIPEGVTSIGGYAFSNCTALTSVTIPSSVTSIGWSAFSNCTGLTNVYYGGNEAQWKAIDINDIFDGNRPLINAAVHYKNVNPVVSAAQITAMPTNDKLTVNSVVQNPTVYKINDSNYFKIRDLAAVLNGTSKQFAVGYDVAMNSVTVTTGRPYTMTNTELAGAASRNSIAEISNDTIYVDGVKIQAEVYKINGSNYFKLRDLGKALDFYVGWDAGRGMYIETDERGPEYPEYRELTVQCYYPGEDKGTITFSAAIIEERTATVKTQDCEGNIRESRTERVTFIKLAPGSYVTVSPNPNSNDPYDSEAISVGGFLKNNCYEIAYSGSVDGFLSGTAEETVGRLYDFIWLRTDQFDTESCFIMIGS